MCKKGEISEEQAQQLRKIVEEITSRGRQQCRGRTARTRTQMAKIRRTRNEASVRMDGDAFLERMEDWQERAWEEVAAVEAEVEIYWSRWNQIKREKGIWYYLWKLG